MAEHNVMVWDFDDILVEHYRCASGAPESVSSHTHDTYQFCLTVGVACEYRYRGERHLVPRNGLNVLHPGEAHTTADAEPRPEGAAYRMLYLHPDVLRQVAAEMWGHSEQEPFFHDPVVLNNHLLNLFRNLYNALEDNNDELERDYLRLAALSQLVACHTEERTGGRKFLSARAEVGRAQQFLEDNADRSVSLDELAQVAGLSTFHLCRLFRRQVGLPPHKYHVQVKVARAKSLLRSGLSIASAAQAAGFYDQSQFGRHFKRLVGVTPGRYGWSKNRLDYTG